MALVLQAGGNTWNDGEGLSLIFEIDPFTSAKKEVAGLYYACTISVRADPLAPKPMLLRLCPRASPALQPTGSSVWTHWQGLGVHVCPIILQQTIDGSQEMVTPVPGSLGRIAPGRVLPRLPEFPSGTEPQLPPVVTFLIMCLSSPHDCWSSLGSPPK